MNRYKPSLRSKRLHQRCAGFERLEHRILLADISWNNLAGGAWETANNWSPALVPGASDNALITLDGTYAVTVNSSRTVQSLTLGAASGTQTLALNVSTFRETAASTVNANGVLVLNAGILADDGGLAVAENFQWNGGTLTGAAATEISAGGTLTISGASAHTLSHALNNSGTIVHDAAGSLQITSAMLNNQPGAVYDFRAGTIDFASTGTALNNTGTFRKSTVSTTSQHAVQQQRRWGGGRPRGHAAVHA